MLELSVEPAMEVHYRRCRRPRRCRTRWRWPGATRGRPPCAPPPRRLRRRRGTPRTRATTRGGRRGGRRRRSSRRRPWRARERATSRETAAPSRQRTPTDTPAVLCSRTNWPSSLEWWWTGGGGTSSSLSLSLGSLLRLREAPVPDALSAQRQPLPCRNGGPGKGQWECTSRVLARGGGCLAASLCLGL